jgi:hypothetical protein
MPKKSRSTKGRRRVNRRKSTKNMLKIGGTVCKEICPNSKYKKHDWVTPFPDKTMYQCFKCKCITQDINFVTRTWENTFALRE